MTRMKSLFFLIMLMVLSLAGCGSSSEEELTQWMADQKNQSRPKVAPMAEPKQFKPETYTQVTAVEPFSNQKLTLALKRESNQTSVSSALIAPELARRKESLEAFPLDTMKMVGSLNKAGQPVALLKVENLLYQVHLGNYIGQNYGRILKIAETQVTLREIVQDAAGEWIERTATLQLQEGSK